MGELAPGLAQDGLVITPAEDGFCNFAVDGNGQLVELDENNNPVAQFEPGEFTLY